MAVNLKKKINNKVAIVTGAGQGIGKAVVKGTIDLGSELVNKAEKITPNFITDVAEKVADKVIQFLSRPLIPDTTVEDPITGQKVHPDFLKLLKNRPDLRQKFNETGSIYSDM